MDRTVPILVGAVLAVLGAASAVHGQQDAEPGMLGIGYVANAPDAMAGVALWGTIPGLNGWGVYVDAKMDPEDPVQGGFLDESVTADEAEEQWPDDLLFVSNAWWRGVNIAITKAVTDEMILYAGGGYAEETVYRQYRDAAENRGILGYYWVEDPDASRTGVNVLLGGFLRISDLLRIQFGGETRPMGFTVGLSFVLGGP